VFSWISDYSWTPTNSIIQESMDYCTTANGSDLFEAIAHQLVAGTYNVPAPSHIIRSVLISCLRESRNDC